MIVGKSPDLVIIGHIAYDQTVNYKDEESLLFPSGAAYFSGLAASLFTKNLGLVSRVGEDYEMGFLTRLGIDLEGVHQIGNGKTTRFYFVYKTPDYSQRGFRSEFNVGADLSPDDIPLRYLGAKHIHIASMPPQRQRLFVEFLKENSQARISLDTIEQFVQNWPKEVAENLQRADLIFLNKREWEVLKTNHFTSQLEDKEIILKKGPEGAVYIKRGERIEVSAPQVETIVDKSGAGDVLAGVFLALLIQGEKEEVALQEAVKLASKSLEGHGVEALLEGRCLRLSRKEILTM